MCTAIALAYSELPLALIEECGLAERIHDRGGEKEIRFYWQAAPALLPVWLHGQLQIVRWGNKDRAERKLPPTGWTWQESIEEGKWSALSPEPVVIPATFGLMNGVWYKVKQGMQGLLVHDPEGKPVVFMVCQPATRYFQVMARANWMPALIDEVKYALSKFETRKMLVYNRLVETNDVVKRSDLPDIYRPVRKLTQFLLPHLTFSRINLDSRGGGVQCLFKREDRSGQLEIDLDDLSSGERAIVSLFMPFLEEEIERELSRLEETATGTQARPVRDLVVLMDEPELHLHPALQARLLEYLREISAAGGVQFILSTHSPTLLSAATHEELFVLMPPTEAPVSNQLVRLASDGEKLQAMRELCGDTYVLTSCRSIICIEGEMPSPGTKVPTDVRLLELVLPEIKSHVLLPFGGKGQTIQAAQRLRELLPQAMPVISVNALIDADQNTGTPTDPLFVPLPVAMIENLLLVPEAIWEYLAPYREKCRLVGATDIKTELTAIARDRRKEEITLRVQKLLKARTVRLGGATIEDVRNSMEQEIVEVRAILPKDEKGLQDIIDRATVAVDEILARGQALAHFHGKALLQQFHQRHVNSLGVGYTSFVVELARTVGKTAQYRDWFADAVLPKLGIPKLASAPAPLVSSQK